MRQNCKTDGQHRKSWDIPRGKAGRKPLVRGMGTPPFEIGDLNGDRQNIAD